MVAVGDCSGEACVTLPGSLLYGTTPAGNAFMLAAFAALIPPVAYAGFRYRTLAHTSLLLAALVFEVVGHVGKIFLAANPTSHAYSILYLMGTHWGAIFIGSAANLVLPHVMVIYGDEFRLVSDPIYVNILFFVLDIFALAFQSVGIGFVSTAHTPAEVRSPQQSERRGMFADEPLNRFLKALVSCLRASPSKPSISLCSWVHIGIFGTGSPIVVIFSMTNIRSCIYPAVSDTS